MSIYIYDIFARFFSTEYTVFFHSELPETSKLIRCVFFDLDKTTTMIEDEPKDIEIEYDDTTVTSVSGSGPRFGCKQVDVRLPNFVYTNKHMTSTGSFKVSKLMHSHPAFFKKKSTKKAPLVSAKSTGGGFSANCERTAAAKKPKKEEWVKSKKANSKPKKGSAKEEPAPAKKAISKAAVDSSGESSDEGAATAGPNLKQVTIKNLKVEIERLHENIVKFKYKQYRDFVDANAKSPEKKGSKTPVAKKEVKSSKAASRKASAEPKKAKGNSRLFDKFGIDTDTSSDEDLKPPGKDSKAKSKSKEPQSAPAATEKSENSVVANPFFGLDEPAEAEKATSASNEKEKLVEMLFSLIKGNKVPDIGIKKEKDADSAAGSETNVKGTDSATSAAVKPGHGPISSSDQPGAADKAGESRVDQAAPRAESSTDPFDALCAGTVPAQQSATTTSLTNQSANVEKVKKL